MDLFDAIAKRYSYRGDFADSPVPRADLEKIVQAGIQAPSACNAQVVSFVIVDDPQLVRQVAEILDKPFCLTAKAMIVCVADPRPVYSNLSFAAEDCAAAVENVLLAITALGYASVWLDGVVRAENRAVRLGQLLGVPRRARSASCCRSACRSSPACSGTGSRSPIAPGSTATAAFVDLIGPGRLPRVSSTVKMGKLFSRRVHAAQIARSRSAWTRRLNDSVSIALIRSRTPRLLEGRIVGLKEGMFTGYGRLRRPGALVRCASRDRHG